MSSGSPALRIAVRRTMRSFIFASPIFHASVPMTPGAMMFAVMPKRAPSSAIDLPSPITAALVAAYEA